MADKLTRKDIENTIQEKRKKFLESRYDGVLTTDLIDLYKRAIFQAPPDIRRMSVEALKFLFTIKLEDISWSQAALIITLVGQASFDALYDSLEEAMERYPAVEHMIKTWNDKYEAVEKGYQIELERRLKLAGLDGQAVSMKSRLVTP